MRFMFKELLSSIMLISGHDQALESASISAYAVDMVSGKVILNHAGDKSLIPSSTLKVVTTAAALSILGEESRFATHLEYDGEIDKLGVLHGNLYIKGEGDPTLGSDRIATSPSIDRLMDLWVEATLNAGVKKIEGRVIPDASFWEKALASPGWLWEDIGNYYGAGASALSFHENLYTLVFEPGKEVGDKTVILRLEPSISEISFENEVKTGPMGSGDRACIYASEFSNKQAVRGTIPLGVKEFSIKGAIPDPSSFAAVTFQKALAQRGIEVEENSLQISTSRTRFYTTYSPLLKEIVKWTNRRSINLYAEHLLKAIGKKVYNEGSTISGIRAVTEFLKGHNINLAGFSMADGSGLSRKNLITPHQIVDLLLIMKGSDVFLDSLSEKMPGERGKSGSMSQGRGRCGYIGNIAYAVLINNCLDEKIDEKIQTFLTDLAKNS